MNHGRRIARPAGFALIVVGSLGLIAGPMPGCASSGTDSSQMRPAESRAQLFTGMGPLHRPVETDSTLAQRYFDQGLTWTYAFNHDEAIRSFTKAGELDPELAMAWWGVALCHGPHINNPVMPLERSQAAWAALEQARRLRDGASPVHRALIDALAARYAWPAPDDRRPLDEAYAAAMQRVYQSFPADADVATLYAEALMDLQPWDLWTLEGQAKGRTPEIITVIEHALRLNPTHPGACHLYIHAVEASAQAERAVAAADTLRSLVPMSSHLVHMPSHIDLRLGKYELAAETNRRAIAADKRYRQLSPKQDFYRLYMQHNEGFLAFACMMLGREREALASSKDAVNAFPPDWVRSNASAIDGYMTMHMDALKRFGKWREILDLPAPPEHLPYTTAMWRFNRAVALAALGRVDEAQAESAAFEAAYARVPESAIAQINPARRVLDLARHMLLGEIAYARGDFSSAETELRRAVAIEDTLMYMEPPDWTLPVRHPLGAVLMDAGRPAEAEAVYLEDLKRWPENGWALTGLAKAQDAQGKSADSAATRARLAKAWSTADITPHASCLCAPKPGRPG